MKIIWTPEKEAEVKKLIEKYIQKHNVSCGESIMQCDDPQIEAPELMADIVDIIHPLYEDEE